MSGFGAQIAGPTDLFMVRGQALTIELEIVSAGEDPVGTVTFVAGTGRGAAADGSDTDDVIEAVVTPGEGDSYSVAWPASGDGADAIIGTAWRMRIDGVDQWGGPVKPGTPGGLAGDVDTVTIGDGAQAITVTVTGAAGVGGGSADPVVVIDATICAAEIDGTDTAVQIVGASPPATASGIIPAGWKSLGTAPDFATLLTYWGLTGLPVDGEDEPVAATVLVVNEGVVVTLDPAALDEPWAVVPASAVIRVATGRIVLRADIIDGDVLYLGGFSLPYDGYGVLDGADDVEDALDTGESALDRPWWETGWSLTENVNLAGLLGPSAPGSQPTLEYGAVVTGEDNNCDVLLLGQTTPAENGVYTVDKTTGVWARQGASTAFWPPGNGAVHTLNAPGEEGDGWMLRWTDDVPWKRQRGVSGAGSYLYPSDTGRFHLFKPDAVLGPFPTQAHPSP